MANISDYLDWRGDLPFSADPFGEVDSLILSELVYTDFGGIVPGPEVWEEVPLEDAARTFFAAHTEEEIMAQVSSTKVAPFLMEKMTPSRRFAGTRLAGYVNCVETGSEAQFAAITFLLPDDSIYVAFRGTDNTIVGWKEDFNMSFLSHTPGQAMAADYLTKNFAETGKTLRVGGHSKGGNFAVYASAFCSKEVQEKIVEIYSNDGPGFQEVILESEEYRHIFPLVKSIVPEQSIVSLLFENDLHHRVVKSDKSGASQHDPMSWQVMGKHFVEAEALSEESRLFDRAFHTWLNELDVKTRRVFSDAVFELLASGGASTLDELKDSRISWGQAMKSMKRLAPEKQEVVKEVVRKLVSTSGETFLESLKERPRPFEKLYGKLFRPAEGRVDLYAV